jgi:hypothetical protein
MAMTGFEEADEAEIIEEAEDEATMNLHEHEAYREDHAVRAQEEAGAGAGADGCCLPTMHGDTKSCAKACRCKHLDDDQGAYCKRESGENWIPVIVDWYITYHPTYRIPQLNFDVSEQGE